MCSRLCVARCCVRVFGVSHPVIIVGCFRNHTSSFIQLVDSAEFGISAFFSVLHCITSHAMLIQTVYRMYIYTSGGCIIHAVTSMDADLNMYPILIPPASNTFHFCHHPQPHHSQPYHVQSIIYHPSFIINGTSRYRAYSITVSIFSIFNRLPSPLRPPLNSVK